MKLFVGGAVRWAARAVCLACAVLALFVIAVNVLMVALTHRSVLDDAAAVPEHTVAIVPGARVYGPDVVSFVFRDRIDGGVALLECGTVGRLLVSGDHGRADYDEVNAALSYIRRAHTVDDHAVFLDHAGFSTYETMYRARDVFCVQDAVVVTQRFHAARAVFIARSLGIDAVAYVPPEQHRFRRRVYVWWHVRESLARVKAFLSVVLRAKPTYLGSQIPVTGDASASWD